MLRELVRLVNADVSTSGLRSLLGRNFRAGTHFALRHPYGTREARK